MQDTNAISRSYDSMTQAAAALAVPLAWLRASKAAGCPAFRSGGRVATQDLIRWLLEHQAAPAPASPPQPGVITMGEAKLDRERAKARIEQMRASELEGRLIALADVEETNGQILTRTRDMLLALGDSLALLCAHQSPDFISRKLRERSAGILEALQSLEPIPAQMKSEVRASMERPWPAELAAPQPPPETGVNIATTRH